MQSHKRTNSSCLYLKILQKKGAKSLEKDTDGVSYQYVSEVKIKKKKGKKRGKQKEKKPIGRGVILGE